MMRWEGGEGKSWGRGKVNEMGQLVLLFHKPNTYTRPPTYLLAVEGRDLDGSEVPQVLHAVLLLGVGLEHTFQLVQQLLCVFYK